MAGYTLSLRALADLEDIRDYTIERWGVEQAVAYVSDIKTALDDVVRHPQRRRSCDNVRLGYFRISSGSHVLFYRVAGDTIDVARILHQSMSFGVHLRGR